MSRHVHLNRSQQTQTQTNSGIDKYYFCDSLLVIFILKALFVIIFSPLSQALILNHGSFFSKLSLYVI